MVLTEASEPICCPAATLESASIAKEKLLFEIKDDRVKTLPEDNLPSSYVSYFSEKVYKTNRVSCLSKKKSWYHSYTLIL
jgi:hypothetical protein